MLKISQTILFEDFKTNSKQLPISSDIIVLKASYNTPLIKERWDDLIGILSPNMRNEITKYLRWEDKHNSLFGKLLVYLGYFIITGKKLSFDMYIRDKNNKPFLKDFTINFNISHSGKAVVCAISQYDIKLGVDIEEVKKIDVSGFKNIFHQNEFTQIKHPNNIKEFYKYWTRKEAFTKAIGKGLTMPLHFIDTTKEIICERKNNFYLESHVINNSNYYCSLAYTLNGSKINWIEVKF